MRFLVKQADPRSMIGRLEELLHSHGGGLPSEEDPFDNFRSQRLDPSLVSSYSLESGTYKQVPSRYATVGNLISVYSYANKSDVPGEKHPGQSADTRFGTTGKPTFDTVPRRLQNKDGQRYSCRFQRMSAPVHKDFILGSSQPDLERRSMTESLIDLDMLLLALVRRTAIRWTCNITRVFRSFWASSESSHQRRNGKIARVFHTNFLPTIQLATGPYLLLATLPLTGFILAPRFHFST